jgi:branched-chain amino acid aminotransferase
MTNLCNVNGEIVPEEDARISVMDRGFLFGDSIYEVTRTREGVPFAWSAHLERLHHSAVGLEMDLGLSDRELTQRIMGTIEAAGNAESYVRVILTRGVGTFPNIDVRYAEGGTTCVIMIRTLPDGLDRPAQVAIVPRLRTDRRSLDPAIKSGNYLNNVMGLKEARNRGASECLFMNQDGKLTEASTSNVWIIQGDTVATPALGAGLLAGVTRRLLLATCQQEGIPCVEKDLYEADVRSADGMFLTSTLREIAPVDELDGTPMPASPLIADLKSRFSEHCRRHAVEIDRPAIDALTL